MRFSIDARNGGVTDNKSRSTPPAFRRVRWLGILAAVVIASAALSATAPAPGATADSAGTPVYAPGNDGSYLAYNRTVRLAHAGAQNGTLLSTFEHGAPNGGAGSLIIRSSADDGTSWTDLSVVRDAETGGTHPWSNMWQPFIYEYPKAIGAYPEGTLLLVMNVVPTAPGYGATHFQSFRSNDHGKTWTFIGVPQIGGTLGSGIWEPIINLDSSGTMNMYFSDERQSTTNSQFLGHIVSTDGGDTWSANADGSTRVAPGLVRDVSSTSPTDRPGMITIANLPGHKFVMSYELCGASDRSCEVYTKNSTDGNLWGTGASDLGAKAVSTDGRSLHSTPFITWTPDGGANGTLMLTGRTPSSPGATILTNTNLGIGPWSWGPAPFTVQGSPNATCSPSYSPDLLPSINGRYLRVTTPTVATNGTCQEQTDTQNAGFLPYNSDFSTGRDRGWLNYGGCFSITGDVYSDTCGGTGGNKSITGSTGWTDYTLQSDIKLSNLSSDGTAGLLVRVTNPTTGTDSLTGYFVGVSGTSLVLGKQNNSWTQLATTPIPTGAATNTWYHLSVQVSGCSFRIQGNPVGSGTTPTSLSFTDTGCSATSGAIGLRDFKTNASWRNVTVTGGSSPTTTDTGVYQAPFAGGTNPNWSTFGGNWTVSAASETLSNTSGGSGDKQLYAPSSGYTDYTTQSDVQLATAGTSGNAGLVVRASNAGVGTDTLNGYYVGFNSSGLVLGKLNNGWTALATAAFTIKPLDWYHLTVTANGCAISATLNAVANATDDVQLTANDCSFASGAFGVRTFGTNASWKNLTASPVQPMPAHWVSAWEKPMAYAAPLNAANFTCRFGATVTASGSALRVRLSNLFVSTPTTFGAVTIAARDTAGSIVAGTSHPLTVNGSSTISIGANSEVTSDAVIIPVSRGSQYEVSLYVLGAITEFSNHSAGIAHGYCGSSGGGDRTTDITTSNMPNLNQNVAWVAGIDALSAASGRTIVALGDSITDGVGSTIDANRRWTDVLATRLAGTNYSVANAGIGGNTLTTTPRTNVSLPWSGPPADQRFARDVLAQAGVSDVVIFEGTNDVCFGATAASLETTMQGLSDRARAAGLRVIGGTMIGRGGDGNGCSGFLSDSQFNSVRTAVNSWIRSTGAFDAVIDFDAVTKNTDPTYRPGAASGTTSYADYDQYMGAAFDSGDHVHPGDFGYNAMAQAIDLSIF